MAILGLCYQSNSVMHKTICIHAIPLLSPMLFIPSLFPQFLNFCMHACMNPVCWLLVCNSCKMLNPIYTIMQCLRFIEYWRHWECYNLIRCHCVYYVPNYDIRMLGLVYT